jgi:hypothetical protein
MMQATKAANNNTPAADEYATTSETRMPVSQLLRILEERTASKKPIAPPVIVTVPAERAISAAT